MHSRQSGASNWGAVIAIVLIIAGAIIFTNLRQRSDSSTPPTNNNNSTAMTRVEVMLSPQNSSGQSGKAILTDDNGKTKIVIEVTPGPKGVAQPAQIRGGGCPTLGGIKYNLNDVIDGRSETVLAPALHFIHGVGQTAISFQKSKEEVSVFSACGDLTSAMNQAMGM